MSHTNNAPIETDLTETARIPVEPMRDLVYGRPRAVPSRPAGVRRFNLRIAGILETKRLTRLAIATGVLVGMLGCNATVPPVQVETVGQLAPAYHSVATAPVHATTDLAPGFQAISTDADQDDAPKFRAADEPGQAPDAVDKTGGLKTGEVR